MPILSSRVPSSNLCYHGGAFFDAIGPRFDSLERRHEVINADVLDAWFPPAPGVLDALRENLDWLARTSPPTDCTGLIEAIAEARGVPADCVLAGAGSSDLIFRAFGRWLHSGSRVLLLDPTYGEYAHVCEQVVGCIVERLPLDRSTCYRIDPCQLANRLQVGEYDLAIIVNPNNPTGQHLPRAILEEILGDIPSTTTAWIDEAYVEYVGAGQSLERFSIGRPNVVVCKSMSKVYALSGMRAAYLCGCRELLTPLRIWTPPWVVGLPAQLAAVRALQSSEYYQLRYRETAEFRQRLTSALSRQHPRWDILEGCANFVLCHMPEDGETAAALVDRCREYNVFLRDIANMGASLGCHVLRIAVKDAATQDRMLDVLNSLATH